MPILPSNIVWGSFTGKAGYKLGVNTGESDVEFSAVQIDFTPKLSTLRFWLRPNDINSAVPSTWTDANPPASLIDVSGNSRNIGTNFSTTTLQRNITGSSSPVLSWTTGCYGRIPYTALPNNTSFTFATIVRFTEGDYENYIINSNHNSTTNNFKIKVSNSRTKWEIQCGSSGLQSISSSFNNNQWYIVSSTFNSSTKVMTLYINGVSVGSYTDADGNFYSTGQDISLATRNYTNTNEGAQSYNLRGYLGDIIICEEITTAIRTRIEGFLAWSVNNCLDNGHTYKNTRPFA